MLIENTLLGTVNKEEIAIQRLRSFEPSDGYYVAFGGGKDSIVVLDIVKRSGVRRPPRTGPIHPKVSSRCQHGLSA